MPPTGRIVRMKWLLLASCFASTATLAESAPAPATGEMHFRMQRSANIDKVLVNSEGDAFALLLAEGSVVMLSSEAPQFGFAPGQRVQVEGDAVQTPLNVVYFRVRLTRGGKLLQSANDAPARAPTHEDCAGGEVTARGALEAFLAAPDGRITGLVFANGTVALASSSLAIGDLAHGSRVEVSGPSMGTHAGIAALRIDRLAIASANARR
jgi:hypothetical protein